MLHIFAAKPYGQLNKDRGIVEIITHVAETTARTWLE